MPGEGARTWLIPDAYLPSAGAGRVAGHEAICILNTGDQAARVEIDVYFEERDPHLGVAVTIGPRRERHIPNDRAEMLGGLKITQARAYGSRPHDLGKDR